MPLHGRMGFCTVGVSLDFGQTLMSSLELSDRYGRTRVLGIAIFGLLFTDLNFISVTKFRRSLPGGYWFFIVGAIVEGCLGGKSNIPIC